MILTEDEAKTKWCPFARVGPEGNRAQKFDDLLADRPWAANCLASECMAWRWKPNMSPSEIDRKQKHPQVPYPNGVKPEGYCGA